MVGKAAALRKFPILGRHTVRWGLAKRLRACGRAFHGKKQAAGVQIAWADNRCHAVNEVKVQRWSRSWRASSPRRQR
jgi:hypothetical protein